MNLIALESSGMTAGVAVFKNGEPAGVYDINNTRTHSETLMPMLEELKRMTGISLSDIDAVAVSAGPGSFTGLRIGAAAAKGIAEALDIPVIPVPALEALAFRMYAYPGYICPMMDARHSQVFSGIYAFSSDKENDFELKFIKEGEAISLDEQLNALAELAQEKKSAFPVMFTGDGAKVYGDEIRKKAEFPFSIAPGFLREQDGAALAAYGEILYSKGLYKDAADFAPEYMRLSQAELLRKEADGDKSLV